MWEPPLLFVELETAIIYLIFSLFILYIIISLILININYMFTVDFRIIYLISILFKD